MDSFSADDIKDFTPPQVVEFLAQLVDKVKAVTKDPLNDNEDES